MRIAFLLLVVLVAGCARNAARTDTAAVHGIEGLPPDSLVILVSGKDAYQVNDVAAACNGLEEVLKPYRESTLVLASAKGVSSSIGDVICIGMLAKKRGGKALIAHPDGRVGAIDIQD